MLNHSMGTHNLPMTTSTLLDLLRSPAAGGPGEGESAWAELDARYRPVLIGFADALGRAGGGAGCGGWSRADAEDAAQWTLAELLKSLRAGVYAREKGRLRSWIMGIARNRVRMIKRSMARRNAVVYADAACTPDQDDATLDAIWTREQERAVRARVVVQGRFAVARASEWGRAVSGGTLDGNAAVRVTGRFAGARGRAVQNDLAREVRGAGRGEWAAGGRLWA
jgi:DNA-directed RNA polymerase specialized sigma24 family protein